MKPVIFSGEMVKAILEGRKTQTRVAVKPRNKKKAKQLEYRQGYGLWVNGYDDGYIGEREANGIIKDYTVSPMWMDLDAYIGKYAPYKPGDVLYVREAFWVHKNDPLDCYKNIIYDADYCDGHKTPDRWLPQWYSRKPSIRMPKAAARIYLRVVDVRVERLREITVQDACNELGKDYVVTGNLGADIAIMELDLNAFVSLWDNLNAKRGYTWESNPWVWKIVFERVKKS